MSGAVDRSLALVDVWRERDTQVNDRAWELPPEISEDEWSAARSAPDCIVENYLFADVALLIAPGGTGKTTLILYEAIHIALGMPLYGLKVRRPGPVLILTAEDTREMLIARLRSIAEAMVLNPVQRGIVQRDIRISDLSGGGCKLTAMGGDKYLVQCKQWKVSKVGVATVRELYGVMTAERAVGGFVVASGTFTDDAKAFAEGRSIKLIDARRLRAMINASEAAPKAPVEVTPAAEVEPSCPKCCSPMVQRTAKTGANAGGKFWGCSRFPACRGTR